MNIFEYYLSEINKLVVNHKNELLLKNLDNLTSEIPIINFEIQKDT